MSSTRAAASRCCCVPGLGNNVDMWKPFMDQFRERRIVRLEAPGTGLSSTPAQPMRIPELSDMLAAILDECRIEWADVVGFSYGGAVAQQFAHDHPARVRRLVLAATFCGVGSVPGSQAAMMSLATPLRYYSPSYYNRTAQMTSGGVTGRDSSVRHWMIQERRRHPPSSVGYTLQLLGILGGPAAISSTRFRTRRWSSAATTTRWCRWPTAGCWPA